MDKTGWTRPALTTSVLRPIFHFHMDRDSASNHFNSIKADMVEGLHNGLRGGQAGPRLTSYVLALSLISSSLASSVSSQEPATSRGTVLTPALVGTADVPFSTRRAIALLANGRTACVVDSYDHRVRCVDPDGSVVGVFGREGEGPGEFQFPSDLTRGESGSVGVFDMGLGRFTIFEPGGALLHTVRLPGSGDLDPTGAFGESRVRDRNDQRAACLRGGRCPRRFSDALRARHRLGNSSPKRGTPARTRAG